MFTLGVKRPVTVLMVALGIMVFGLVSLNRLPVTLLPELTYPTLTVRTEIPGSAPEEVENNVSIPLEEALGVVSHLRSTESHSRPERSDLLLRFAWGTDMDLAAQDVNEKLQTVFLPTEAKKPLVLRFDPGEEPVLRYILTGPQNKGKLRYVAEHTLKRSLEKLDGVAAVRVRGGIEEEIHVVVDRSRLATLNLTMDQLSRRISASNINAAGGNLKEGKAEFIVRTVNEFKTLKEIGATPLVAREGRTLYLRDVAQITRGGDDPNAVTRLNGVEGVAIEILREADANIVSVSDRVQKVLKRPSKKGEKSAQMKRGKGRRGRGRRGPSSRSIYDDLPKGSHLELMADQAHFVRTAISNLRNAAIVGGLLAVLILFLFLGDWRATGIVALSIPLSVVAAFAALYLSGVSLNVMTLGGLALGVGMLVDNSIVVLESMARCVEEGDSRLEAAVRGTREVGMAVTASTLTTVAVFLPIVFVGGVAGQIFKDLALSVVYSLLASLLVAIFFIPMLASRTAFNLHKRSPKSWLKAIWNPWFLKTFHAWRHLPKSPLAFIFRWPVASFSLVVGGGCWFFMGILLTLVGTILGLLWGVGRLVAIPLEVAHKVWQGTYHALATRYEKELPKALEAPAGVFSAALVALIVTGFLGMGLDTVLLPQSHEGRIEVDCRMPVGTPLNETDHVLKQLAIAIKNLDGVQSVAARVGVEPDDLTTAGGGDHTGILTVTLEHPKLEGKVLAPLRSLVEHIPDMNAKVKLPSLVSQAVPLEVEVESPDLGALTLETRAAANRMASVPGLTDVRTTLQSGYPEVHILFDRERLALLNLDIRTVSEAVRSMVEGTVATRFREGERRLDIRLRLREKDRATVKMLENLPLPNTDPSLPLSAVATVAYGRGPAEITRRDQRRVGIIQANLQGLGIGGAAEEVTEALGSLPWAEGTHWRFAGQREDMAESKRGLLLALVLSVILVYLIMASQFESILHPMLIMVTIPLALVGVILGLLITGLDVSVLAGIGVIMLAGIVVNNAIVLLDYTNQLRRRGQSLKDAVTEAARVRLRPILITTFTTLIGLLPLALAFGQGAELQQPLAVAVIFGLGLATLLTLVLLPTLYLTVEKWRMSGEKK